MQKGFLKTAFILGALAVALGAFGAHGLKDLVSQRVIVTFETAIRYQFYHVFALLFAAILYKDFNNKWVNAAGWFFIAGILLFSGSLYLLCYVQALVLPGYQWLGPITPIGGLSFIVGWICMFLGIVKKK
jgi:uncharacterized membrane protein YgdD (TMEM256/DUF423 family)